MPTDRHSADDADHNQNTSGEQSSHNTTATVIPEVESDSSETSAASSSRHSHSQRSANSQSRNVEESAKAEAPEDSEGSKGSESSEGSEGSQRSADTADTSESEEGKDQQKLKKLPTWSLAILAIGALYMLLVAIGVIGDGFKEMGSDTAKGLFDFATNPFIALFVGILATSIIQSSSTTTAIVVTMVAAGAVPMEVAIPMVMGANIGTSVTNTLASLGHAGKDNEFKRAITAATVHDYFNLFAVIILLPIELIFHPIQHSAQWLSNALYGNVLPNPEEADFLGIITDPVVEAIGPKGLLGNLPGSNVVVGAVTILLGVIMIFLAVRWLGKILQLIVVGRAKKLLEKSIGGNPMVAMGAGAAVTVAAQSSSVTTSVMIPFAGSGALTPRQIYPMTLGANVGTTVTTIIAAMAVTDGGGEAALTIAFVHLLFNVFGIAIIYGIPFLRLIPLRCAELLAKVAAQRKYIAIAWVLGVFIILPAAMILAKVVFF